MPGLNGGVCVSRRSVRSRRQLCIRAARLGAGVAVKKKIDDAKDTITEQRTELEELREKMSVDLQKITEYIMQRSPEAEELMQKVEGKTD